MVLFLLSLIVRAQELHCGYFAFEHLSVLMGEGSATDFGEVDFDGGCFLVYLDLYVARDAHFDQQVHGLLLAALQVGADCTQGNLLKLREKVTFKP